MAAAEDPWEAVALKLRGGAAASTAVVDAPQEIETPAAVVPTPAPAPVVETAQAPPVAAAVVIGSAAPEPTAAVVVPQLVPDPVVEPTVEATAAAPALSFPGVAPEAMAQMLAMVAAAQAVQPASAAVTAPLPVTPEPEPEPEHEPEHEPEPEGQGFPPFEEVVDPEEAEPAVKGKTKKGNRRERRRGKGKEVQPEVPAGPPQTAKWTGGNALAAHAVSALVAVGLLAGPAALALAVVNTGQDGPVVVAGDAEVEWDAATTAGERARELVSAWLSASRADNVRLSALYPGTLARLPENGLEARDIAVAQVSSAGDGVWSVLVGADVKISQPTEQDPAATAWVRQFFQVPVAVAETGAGLGVQLLALPAPMPGPVAASGAATAYTERLTTTSQVAESAAGFFAALLTGQGDITRYMTPGTSLSPITPAPYTEVVVRTINATRTDANIDDPEQGDSLGVFVELEVTRVDGEKTSTAYALDMTARDGRWEVSAVSDAPALKAASSSSTSTQELPATAPEQNVTPNAADANNGGN